MERNPKPIEKNNDNYSTDADDRTRLQPVSLGEIKILMRQWHFHLPFFSFLKKITHGQALCFAFFCISTLLKLKMRRCL